MHQTLMIVASEDNNPVSVRTFIPPGQHGTMSSVQRKNISSMTLEPLETEHESVASERVWPG